MSPVATESYVCRLVASDLEAMHAIPLTLASSSVKSDHIAAVTIVIYFFFRTSLSEYDRHYRAIWAEVNASIFVFRTRDVLHCLVDQVPDGEAQLEVGDREDVPTGWRPPAVSQPSQTFINLAVPARIIDIAGEGDSALLDAN